ncbi:MAG: polymer-forming cytoskeletal protein [Acidobacteriota bacterium]
MLRIGQNPNEGTNQTEANQNSETHTRPAIETASASRALTDSEVIANEIKDGSLSGFVNSGTLVTGDVQFKEMLRIDGRVSGRINSTSGKLIVGAGGRVDANVDVSVVIVHGLVNGDVIASRRVELGRVARVTGNVQTPSLVIEQGAIFDGTCKMVQQPSNAEKPAEAVRESKMSYTFREPLVTSETSNRITDEGLSKKSTAAG